MPYARRTRPRTYRRRGYFSRYRKGSRYYKSRMSTRTKFSKKRITSLGTVFPRQCYQKLKYSDVWDLTTGAGSHALQVFRPTDLNDMDYTGVGGSPTGFATMITAYKYWQVKGYKITVTFTNTSATNQVVGLINVGEDFAMPAVGTAVQQELMENNNGRHALLGKEGNPGSMKTLKMYIRPKSIVGDMYKDADYRGSGANNPSRWLYTALLMADQTGGVVACTCRAVVTITAYVKWSQRIFPYTD